MYLMDNPKAGLLWKTLKTSYLSWLIEVIPKEDIQQEAALFLLGWTKESIDADLKGFFQAANRHFYRVAVNYGFKRPRGSSSYSKMARFEPRDKLLGYNPLPGIENFLELQEYLKLCKRIILSRNAGTEDWYLFQGYLSGMNFKELAFLTSGKIDSKEVKKRLKEMISQIRKVAGIEENLPMPPTKNGGKMEFQQGQLLGAGTRPNKRRVAIPPELSMRQIMKNYGVDRSTAWRTKKRGWYCPDYHKKIKILADSNCHSSKS